MSNLYAVLTSIYYIIFGLLGCLSGKLYVNHLYSYMIIIGIFSIVEFSGSLVNISSINNIHYIPLSICTGSMLTHIVSESLRKLSQTQKFKYKINYHILSAIFNIIISAFVILIIIFNNIYIYIGLLSIHFIIYMIIPFVFFPIGSQHYYIIREMCFKLCLSIIVSCIAIGTSNIDLNNGNHWYYAVQVFIGNPSANIFLTYFIFTGSQIITLLRGINMRRKIIIKGTKTIFIVLYIGRDFSLNNSFYE